MFKRKHEVENLTAKVNNRDNLIEYQYQKIKKLKEENLAVHEENKDLRFEIEELKDTFKEINKLLTCNVYNDKEALDRKIKELVQTAIQN